MKTFAQWEIRRHSWHELRTIKGEASVLPEVLLQLLHAETPAQAEGAYWRLENTVVVQGQLFSSAVPLVSVLLAALCGQLSRPAKIASLELLLQLVSGHSDESEAKQGRTDLGHECRQEARNGLWLLYSELDGDYAAAAAEILERIELVDSRLLGALEARGLSLTDLR